jgi:C_GCAxxG_C_C family probable redox protein
MALSEDEAVEEVTKYVDQGFLCVEAVLKTLADAKGVESEYIPAIATGMAAGVGRTGQICGAVTGAILGLGLWFGRNKPVTSVRKPYWYSRLFIENWMELHNDISCSGLLGLELDTPEDLTIFQERNFWEVKCRKYIVNAVKLAIYIINEKSDYMQR